MELVFEVLVTSGFSSFGSGSLDILAFRLPPHLYGFGGDVGASNTSFVPVYVCDDWDGSCDCCANWRFWKLVLSVFCWVCSNSRNR